MIHINEENDKTYIYATFSELLSYKNETVVLTLKSDLTGKEYSITLGNNLSSNRRIDKYALEIVQEIELQDKNNQILFLPTPGFYNYTATTLEENTLIEKGRFILEGNTLSVYN